MTLLTTTHALATGQIAAHIFSDFERMDRHWEARIRERYLGLYESLDEDDELARVAILGRIDGNWFAATCLVNGEGGVQDLIGCRPFECREDAERAWRAMR